MNAIFSEEVANEESASIKEKRLMSNLVQITNGIQEQ